MPNNTFAAQSLFLISLYLFSSFAIAEDIEQNPLLIPANSQEGFEYPYYLLIPETLSSLEKHYLIVETNNSGVQTDFARHIENTRKDILGIGVGPLVAKDLQMPLLIPVFPRSKERVLVYTHALDRDSMLENETQDQRLDLQLLRMIEDARRQLKSRKITIEKKFVMVGFSASGTFSNRFAFLHPSSLLAVSSGAVNSLPMLPIAADRGTKFNYPLGIGDIKEITGNEFDRENWVSLAQMIYMGAVDDNDTLKFSDAFSDQERELVLEFIGEDMAMRWSYSQKII